MDYQRLLSYRFPLTRGDDVRAVQLALHSVRIDPPCGDSDGIYGQQTSNAVLLFQQSYNIGRGSAPPLDQDGKVGPKTWQALLVKPAGAAVVPPITAPNAVPEAVATGVQVPASQVGPPAGLKKAKVPNDVQQQTLMACNWLLRNFAKEIDDACNGTPFDRDLVCAIASKETGIKWLFWVDSLTPDKLLARCVFDASGDMPGTARNQFPTNAAAFRDRYGEAFTAELIDEANQTRALQNWGPQPWLYKGYGIFQYDLQNIAKREEWFRTKGWRTMPGCLKVLMEELQDKHASSNGILRETVRRYNGSGGRAEAYADDVMQRIAWIKAT